MAVLNKPDYINEVYRQLNNTTRGSFRGARGAFTPLIKCCPLWSLSYITFAPHLDHFLPPWTTFAPPWITLDHFLNEPLPTYYQQLTTDPTPQHTSEVTKFVSQCLYYGLLTQKKTNNF